MGERPQRNLALELVRATEAAAMVAARLGERGEREAAGLAAAQAMRLVLQTIDMDGTIVIGEGEKGETPVLFRGEIVGTGRPPAVDVAVDPIEGPPTKSLDRPNTLAMVALADRWSLWDPGPCRHLEVIAAKGPARDAIDLNRGPVENLRAIAAALNRSPQDMTVFVVDEPRHEALVQTLQAAGVYVRRSPGGFVLGAILAAMDGTGVDVLMGIARASEAVLAATAVKALGGALQARRAPQDDTERVRLEATLGPRLREILGVDDLVRSDDVFFAATGITDGALLRGVQFHRDSVVTDSIVMRARTGTVRYVRALHRLDKLMGFSQIDYTGEGRLPYR
jgi:fructose-1,6-bisphosphatase II